ncbi:MAG: metallopeptidase family protein [Limnochordaceae bacterium]|nr:metallopeptidase family protein [Limnochordaceae bacterium]
MYHGRWVVRKGRWFTTQAVSLRTFRAIVARVLDRFPEEVLEQLEAGVLVVEDRRRYPNDPPDVYVLGEYVEDPVLGRHVVLYYGSFRAILGSASPEEIEEEVVRTLAHELRHHLESRAGVEWLDEQDWRELQQLRARNRSPRRKERTQDP